VAASLGLADRRRAAVMIAQAIRTFDRSPVPARSAVAVRPPGSKRLGQLSDYVDEFDPFAGVFALFLLLALLTALFVLQLGGYWQPPRPPLTLEVALVPEPAPEPVIQTSAPPPTSAVRPRDSMSLGKGNDPADTGAQKAESAGRPVVAPLSVPSENRLLNEAPKPMSSEITDPRASTAATPVPFSADAAKNNADTAPRSAAAETPPAGTVQQPVVPTAPEESEPGGPKDAGAGAMLAAGPARGPKPPYPVEARRQGLEGKVLLRVTVAPDGRITSVTVVESSGHSVLDRSARDTVARRWRFTPARRATGAVASVYDVPIEFKLNN
jgi:protein TonB